MGGDLNNLRGYTVGMNATTNCTFLFISMFLFSRGWEAGISSETAKP